VWGVTGWLTTAVGVALALALPGSASALDSGHGSWEPGMMLVRFRPSVGASERARIASAASARLYQRLPLVDNLWELKTDGKVESAIARLEAQPGTEYAQPDYVNDRILTGASYFPNDPYFWPFKLATAMGCSTATPLSGWQYWPLGMNLTDPATAGANQSPLKPEQQWTMPGGDPKYASYHSINVLPVWQLLLDDHRLGTGGTTKWTSTQIRTDGVGVIDTGIAPHPDLNGQIAAEWSVVNSAERDAAGALAQQTRIREVFSDDPGRDDLEPVRIAFKSEIDGGKTQLQATDRPLFLLDDAFGFDTRSREQSVPPLPDGCTTHGTAVASLVSARGGNGVGTVGAGFDVPLIGIRQGMPWDRPGGPNASDQRLVHAREEWKQWEGGAAFSDAEQIDQYALVEALGLPVINMSYVFPLVAKLSDTKGVEHPVIKEPAVVEALARVLSTGRTLGVGGAGNFQELYGSGNNLTGARLYDESAAIRGVEQPCGLPLIGKLHAWTAKTIFGSREVASEPYDPGVDWSKVELICIAGTSSSDSRLVNGSGGGDAGVQLAAPGQGLTIDTRPAVSDPLGEHAYRLGAGTSFAAPIVAGAAALLRVAAPGAPIDMIRRALEHGARMNFNLQNKVRYGSLDVACALRWLDARRRPDWKMLPLSEQADPNAYPGFIAATSACGGRRPEISESRLPVEKAKLYGGLAYGSLRAVIASADHDYTDPDSVARRWQELLIASSGAAFTGGGTAFPIGRGFGRPLSASQLADTGPVYRAGGVTVGCPTEGYAITGLQVVLASVIRPPGWVFPTDSQKPTKHIELMVAFAKPWYSGFVDSRLVVRVRAICQYFPQVTQ